MADLACERDSDEIVALDKAVRRLGALDARLGKVVRLCFYAGLSIEDAALALDVSPRRLKRDWVLARA